MANPARAHPESMTPQQYDIDAVTTTLSAWTPSSSRPFARGFYVITTGTLVVDTAGPEDGATAGGSASVTLQAAMLVVGSYIPLAIKAIHASSVATVQPTY